MRKVTCDRIKRTSITGVGNVSNVERPRVISVKKESIHSSYQGNEVYQVGRKPTKCALLLDALRTRTNQVWAKILVVKSQGPISIHGTETETKIETETRFFLSMFLRFVSNQFQKFRNLSPSWSQKNFSHFSIIYSVWDIFETNREFRLGPLWVGTDLLRTIFIYSNNIFGWFFGFK